MHGLSKNNLSIKPIGFIVLFLNLSRRVRTWLIVLPFIGIILDLASLWLKLFIHPVFFWLHIPGAAFLVSFLRSIPSWP